MKILFLIDNLGSGGAQRQLVAIAPLLKQRGFEPEVLCYWDQNFFAPILENENITIHWKIEPNFIKRIWKVRHFIRKGDYNVVISFLGTPDLLNCIAGIGGKKWKIITSERSSKEEFFNSKRGKLFGWFQKYSDLIICNSENAGNFWLKYYPQYKQKIKIIYNVVSLPPISSKYIARKDGRLHIIIAASYQYLKNPLGVIKSLSLMNDLERKEIQIDWYGIIEIVSGNRQAYDESLSLIESFGLQGVVNFYPETEDIINRMNEADVVALFSSIEGLPNTICEGMKLGKPIIMSRVSDYSTLVDESNGFLCDWDNPESIKEALVSAMNMSQEQLIEMGRSSKSKAISLFSEEKIIRKWIAAIEQNEICE